MTSPRNPTLRCAFLSCDSLDDYVVDDDRAYEPFAAAHIVADRVSWHARDVDWNDWDVVMVRSTWDYTDDPEGFFAVLASIDASRAALANPLTAMRWNARKTYLRDLADSGAPVVETVFGTGLDSAGFADLEQRFGAGRWVLKPVVGANAEGAFLLGGNEQSPDRERILCCYGERAWMAQPFMENVQSDGEYSLFYFASEYSHAIRKTPKTGDFRVQEEHGGLIALITADSRLRAAGQRVLDALPADLLYARIDLVSDAENDYRVMEVELIEPSLYLRMDPESPHRLARALRRWLDTGGRG